MAAPEPDVPFADWLSTVADSRRLTILKLLEQNALAVREVCDVLGLQQPAASHHLKRLQLQRLVTSRRDGNLIYYARNTDAPAWPELQHALDQTLARWTPPAAVACRFARVLEARAASSRRFFESLPAQEAAPALVGPEEYEDDVLRLLSAHTRQRGHAVELGPGEGRLLPLLARTFKQVTAVDPVASRLERARQRVDLAGLTNVGFRALDPLAEPLSDAPERESAPDAIVAVMVLHHLSAPAALLQWAGRCLAADGVLLLVELCAHEQDWVRARYGDLWLGFEPATLENWAGAAGLTLRARQFYGHRNGFRSQLCVFAASGLAPTGADGA